MTWIVPTFCYITWIVPNLLLYYMNSTNLLLYYRAVENRWTYRTLRQKEKRSDICYFRVRPDARHRYLIYFTVEISRSGKCLIGLTHCPHVPALLSDRHERDFDSSVKQQYGQANTIQETQTVDTEWNALRCI